MKRRTRVLAALALGCGLALAAACRREAAPAPRIPDAEAPGLLADLLADDAATRGAALDRIVAVGDVRYAAPLIEWLRMAQLGALPGAAYNAHVVALEKLSGQSLGGDWYGWMRWLEAGPGDVPPGFAAWKGRLFARIDPRFAEWLSDDAGLRIPAAEIDWTGVPVDGIPALDAPAHVPIAEAAFLDPGEPVLGVVRGGEARAYPLRLLDWHEIANDTLGGEPIAVVSCAMSGSAIVYAARDADVGALHFGSTGLLRRSNKLFFDRETRSLWSQLTGEAVAGPRAAAGARLAALPAVVTRAGDWAARHPQSTVIAPPAGHEAGYQAGEPYGSYYASNHPLFPVPAGGDELPDKERVFGVVAGGEAHAFALESLVRDHVSNVRVGEEPLVLVAGEGRIHVDGHTASGSQVGYDVGAAVRAYRRGAREFRLGPDDASLVDQRDGVWRIDEDALVGPDGARAERVPGTLAYWFVWHALHPRTGVSGEGAIRRVAPADEGF